MRLIYDGSAAENSLTANQVYEGSRWNEFCYLVTNDLGEKIFCPRESFIEESAVDSRKK